MELLHLDLQGIENVRARVAGAAERARDLTPVWDLAHSIFVDEMVDQFTTQGQALLGTPWVPLNPKYAEKKHRIWGEPPAPLGILYRSGELFQSLTDDGHEAHIKVIEPGGAIFGSTIPYGMYHQTGAVIHAQDGSSWHLPQRKIVHMRERTKKWILRAAVSYILRGSRFTRQGGEYKAIAADD